MIVLFIVLCNQDRQIPSQQTSVPDDNDNNHRDHSPTQQSQHHGKYI